MLPEWYRPRNSAPNEALGPRAAFASRAVHLVFCETFFCFSILWFGDWVWLSSSRQCAARVISLWLVLPARFWLHPARSLKPRRPSPRRSRTAPPRRLQPQPRSPISARWRFRPVPPAAAISAAIGNINTAFLTQQGSAFVSAPADPAPDQPGGGVWARGVGGQANISSTSNSVGISTQGGATINTATTNCNNQQRQTFAGAQVGTDIARLNYARLESPSRHDRRLSQLADDRQRRLRQRIRGAVLGHLSRRHQGPLLCRPDGSPGVLQHQPEQPGLQLSSTSRSERTASRSRRRRVTISISARAGSSSRRPASSIPAPRSTASPRPASPAPTSPASPASFRPTTSTARSAARRCASARPSRRRP